MTSKHLQSEKADLETTLGLLNSFREFMVSLRDTEKFKELLEAGKKLSGCSEFSLKRTKLARQTVDDKSAPGVAWCSEEEFRISTFLVIIDSLCLHLDKRIKAYLEVDKLFSFLLHPDVETDVSLKKVVNF